MQSENHSERCRSGLTGTPGKRVNLKRVSGVRIPLSPPKAKALKALCKNKNHCKFTCEWFFLYEYPVKDFAFERPPPGGRGKASICELIPVLKRKIYFIVGTGLPGTRVKTKRDTAEPPLSECCRDAAGSIE